MSYDGNTVALASEKIISSTLRVGAVAVYRWNGQNYSQIGQELSLGTHLDKFGEGLDITYDGNRIAVCTAINPGKAFIYDYNGTEWVLFASFGNAGQPAICDLAISGNGTRLLAGGGTTGGTYVYDYTNNEWTQTEITRNGNMLPGYGLGISGDGNTIGTARPIVFRKTQTGWDSSYGFNVGLPFVSGKIKLSHSGEFFAAPWTAQVPERYGYTRVYRDISTVALTYERIDRDFDLPILSLSSFSSTSRVLVNSGGQSNLTVYDVESLSWVQVGQTLIFPSLPANAEYSAAISRDGKTIGRGQRNTPNSGGGIAESFAVWRKELD
jgi:hypothetical protein